MCIKNYKPVTLLSASGKLFEIIFHRYAFNYFGKFCETNIMGFVPSVTNLPYLTKTVTKFIDARIQVDVV